MSEPHRTTLVLGASGALGSRLATGLAAAGHTVIGTASTAQSVARIPAEVTSRHVVDLQSPESCADLLASLHADESALTGVVIASGVVGFAPIEQTPPHLAAAMMSINHLGPAAIVAGLLPQLQAAESGTAFVLGITGIVVEQTFPGMSAYTASKSAHSAFLQSIAKEWRRYKVASIDVRLGHTETGLAGRAMFGAAPSMPEGHDPQHVADVIMAAIARRDNVVMAGAF